jgi:hypothetical protein
MPANTVSKKAKAEPVKRIWGECCQCELYAPGQPVPEWGFYCCACLTPVKRRRLGLTEEVIG